MRPLMAAAGVLAVGGIALIGSGVQSATSRQARPAAPAAASAPASALLARDGRSGAIAKTEAELQRSPNNWLSWAQLGSAYVQQGRIAVDPSYYPKAEEALQKSLTLHPAGNAAALVGQGSLANARHDFAGALRFGQQAAAIDEFNASAYGVIDDAATQLGDYPAASAAVQRMLRLAPGVSSFARASYDDEEHGDLAGARNALERALRDASTPADIAFCHYYLGELAFNSGQVEDAARQYQLALAADSSYDPALAGKAKAEAAGGDSASAVKDYTTVINRVPQPQYVIELGELEQSLGQTDEAAKQYQLLDVEQKLFAANGVVDDLLPAQFGADHGDAANALVHARNEWARRHSVLVADALAWALHATGNDTEALGYAQQATSLGWRNALFFYHLGIIEHSLGQDVLAKTHLTAALAINPHFSPLQVPLASDTLAAIASTP